jgi:hypothetical protein
LACRLLTNPPMRLRGTLLQIALVVSAGSSASACGGTVTSDGDKSDARVPGDGRAPDASGDAGEDAPVVACGGCNCGTPDIPSASATPAEACQIAHQNGFGGVCNTVCDQPTSAGALYCTLPSDYSTAYLNAQTDGGAADAGDAGPVLDGGVECPPWTGDVVVQCGYQCLGRRTDGVPDPEGCEPSGASGPLLAERAYLEAVSVHAFARLEAELAAHGSPVSLRRRARKARRDEMRHTSMMARLARRYGSTPSAPPAPSNGPLRSLFAIARENAVEGCVRETYGAVVGIVESRTSSDPDVRRAMRSIADDECRHAELSWAVAAWILPQLTSRERREIDRAMQQSIAGLARDADPRIVRELERHVWNRVHSA